MSVAAENEFAAAKIQEELALNYLATGEYQHVFQRAGESGDPWVFKIPAAFGFVLPFEQPQRFFWPETLCEKLIYHATLSLPQYLERRISKRLTAIDGHGPMRRLGVRLAARYCRLVRLRCFREMLGVIDRVASHGLSEILLPYRIIRRCRARLDVDGRQTRYEGPMLVQRRALLFEEGVDFVSVNWQDIVDAQHMLWKCGIGVSGGGEMLGTRSWALLDDRISLADTSALTTNKSQIRANIQPELLDKAQNEAVRHLDANGLGRANYYLTRIRQEINLKRFNELWGSGL